MPHANDVDDSPAPHDLEAFAAEIARFEDVIVGRCVTKLRGSLDAEDVAQDVKLRLLDEFRRGKRYGELPYRVVVHQVIKWTIADYFAGRPTDVPLPEGWEPVAPGDPESEVVSRGWVEWVVSHLDGRDGVVFRKHYLRGQAPAEIANELGMERNAVDQALYRGRAKIRELFL